MRKCSLCFLVDLNKTKLCPQKYVPFGEKFISLPFCQCSEATREHFEKWKSHLDLGLVPLAAGSVLCRSQVTQCLCTCLHITSCDMMTTCLAEQICFTGSSRGAQEQCWCITNCKDFPTTIILSFQYVHRETCLSAFCLLVL